METQKDTRWLVVGSAMGAALGALGVWAYLRWGREFATRRKNTQKEPVERPEVKVRDLLDLGMLVLRLVRQVVQLMRPV